MWLVHAEPNIHFLDQDEPSVETESQIWTIIRIFSSLQEFVITSIGVCCFSPLKLFLRNIQQ